jgi:CarboxypepD_reg-like domain
MIILILPFIDLTTSRMMAFKPFFVSISFLFIFSFSFITSNGQQSIKGKIFNQKDNKPLSNASVRIPKGNKGSVSDAAGNFEVRLQNRYSSSDSFMISSVGFKTLKVAVNDGVTQSKFYLTEDSKDLETVTIKSYSNEASEGSHSEVTGYFRSWYTKKTGGEIGRILYVNSDDYKLERVRFKINNQCDTCVLRLHIRSLRNGIPDMDLLRDSISIVTGKMSFDDKFSEFDLRNYNIFIKKNKYVFVSLETLHCNSINNAPCSLCYIGTEQGNFLYRPKVYSDWEESTEHSIYLRMFYKY